MINAFLQIKIGRDEKNPLSLSRSTYFLLQIYFAVIEQAGQANSSIVCSKTAQTGQANPELSAQKKRAGWPGQSLNCLLKKPRRLVRPIPQLSAQKHRRREELTYIKHLVKLSINTHCFDKCLMLARERRLVRKGKT